MNLTDLFDQSALGEMIGHGYVRVQSHPSLPLRILNYTERAAYERVWNPVTLTCRGLIIDEDGDVVARPFPKFFNYGEANAPTDTSGQVTVTDKLDGSLGILYQYDGQLSIATRGSFASEQAIHATSILRARYSSFEPIPNATYLFEIVYPQNRIVVDYGSLDDLILLGVVHDTGESYGPIAVSEWRGPRAETMPYGSFSAALAAPPRPGAEGMVVHFLSSGHRLKLKQDDYVALHCIVTGLTARRLWESAAVWSVVNARPTADNVQIAKWLKMDPETVTRIFDAGSDWLATLNATVPEEFRDWIDVTLSRFRIEISAIVGVVLDGVRSVRPLPRREAAELIRDHPYRGMIFTALDDNDITPAAWLAVYPEHERP